MAEATRGEIWLADLSPIRGHEQGGQRPCLVISANAFNRSILGLVIVLPLTSKRKGFPSHVQIEPHDSGLKLTSFAKCEDIRSISTERLVCRMGKVDFSKLMQIEGKLKIILDF
jgi:mRNA interferase MazF